MWNSSFYTEWSWHYFWRKCSRFNFHDRIYFICILQHRRAGVVWKFVLKKRFLSEIVILIRIWVLEFCHNFSCWVLSQFELLNFVIFWVLSNWVEFCPNSSLSVLLQFKFMSFVTIWFFEFFHNFSYWVLSQF